MGGSVELYATDEVWWSKVMKSFKSKKWPAFYVRPDKSDQSMCKNSSSMHGEVSMDASNVT